MANPTLGLPLFLFPCRFQVRVCLVMLIPGQSLPSDVAGRLPEGMANPTLGLPLFLFPCRFQVRVCLVMLLAGFPRVWPIQSPLSSPDLCGSCFQICCLPQVFSLLIFSGHRMQRTLQRQLLMKVFTIWSVSQVVLRVSDP